MPKSDNLIHLGGNVSLDLPTLIRSRMLLQANSGGGKSWAIRRLLEQSHGKVQQLVIDLEGEFSTLREKFDYVIAGKGGDTAADPRSAKLLGRRLIELNVSAICDISELKAHERQRFVKMFLESLVDAPAKLRHPVVVVIDEAHIFCPQAGSAESGTAVIDLCTRGRKRGLCAVLATQRLSKLHKDACAELGNKMIGCTGLDIDQKRAADELGISDKDERRALRTLKPGQFHVFGPALRVKGEGEGGVVQVTVGTVQTKHPELAADLKGEPPAPTEKIKKVLADLADLPEQAEKEVKDNAELRKEVASLKREITRMQKEGGADPEAARDRDQAVADLATARQQTKQVFDYCEQLRKHISNLAYLARQKSEAIGVIRGGIEGLSETLADLASQAPVSVLPDRPGRSSTRTVRRQSVTPRPAVAPVPKRSVEPTIPSIADTGELTGPQRRILEALAKCEAVGITPVKKAVLAAIAGYSVGGAFNNPLGNLRSAGLIDYPGPGVVDFTDAGRSLVESDTAPITLEELHSQMLSLLNGPQQKILSVVLEAHPERITKEELAERAGYAIGGAFNNPLGRLRSMGLVTKTGPIGATDILFPDGLA